MLKSSQPLHLPYPHLPLLTMSPSLIEGASGSVGKQNKQLAPGAFSKSGQSISQRGGSLSEDTESAVYGPRYPISRAPTQDFKEKRTMSRGT